MRGRHRHLLIPVLALMVAVAGLAAIKLTGSALPGLAIRTTELGYELGASTARVGDTVLFSIGTLDIAPGTTIEVVRIDSADATGDLRVVNGRVYDKKDFDNAEPMGWQSNRGNDRDDPRARPSTTLVGSRLTADPEGQRFILLEYLVCAAGDSAVEGVNIVYSVGGFRYEQTLHLHFAVRDAQPSTFQCPRS